MLVLEKGEQDAPPIWWAHRETGPSRPINHAFVFVDNVRQCRIDRPEVLELDEGMLFERIDALAFGRHDIRIDFRAETGRGALAQIRFPMGEDDQPLSDGGADTDLAALCARLMTANERLMRMVLDGSQAHGREQMDTHERLVSVLTISMERDRARHEQAVEREENLRRTASERNDNLAARHGSEQKELLSMLIAQINASAGSSGGAMGGLESYISERIADGLAGQIETMMDRAESPPSATNPIMSAIETLAPIVAEKFGGGDKTQDIQGGPENDQGQDQENHDEQ
jgi:hypothetical protein